MNGRAIRNKYAIERDARRGITIAVGQSARRTQRHGVESGTSRPQALRSLKPHARLVALAGILVLGSMVGCALAQKNHPVVTGQAFAAGLPAYTEASWWSLMLLGAFPLALGFAVAAAVVGRRDARRHIGGPTELQHGDSAEMEWPAKRPADSEWDIPVLANVPDVAAVGEEKPKTVRRGFAGETPRGPVLVDELAPAEERLHEKMAPELSRRQETPWAAGEAGMRRTTSWLDRLRRRKAASAGIVRDNHSGQDDASADNKPAQPAEVRSAKSFGAGEDYSRPLAARLDPISWQGAAAPAWTEKVPTRLQIVPPDEPFEIVVPPSRPLLDAGWAGPEIEARVEPVVAECAEEPAETEAMAEPLLDHEENPSAMTAQTSSPECAVERVRPVRPLSFQQLTELTQQRMEPLIALQADLSAAAAEAEPIAEPVIQVAPVEVESQVQKPAAMAETESERAIEPQPHMASPETPQKEFAPAVRQVATPQVEDSWSAIWAHKPVVPVEEPVLDETDREEYPAQYDAEDIEPVYEEASRHLTTGRWDPIPTLRPDSNAWRERPSPVPPSNPALNGPERPRWTGVDETPSSGGYRTEPLPETLLTRQWGLLSKFQQARNSSGQRPVAKTGDEDGSVSKNGKH